MGLEPIFSYFFPDFGPHINFICGEKDELANLIIGQEKRTFLFSLKHFCQVENFYKTFLPIFCPFLN